jgi:hypothetical protein
MTNASADDLREATRKLLDGWPDAASVMPVSWIKELICDLSAATVHADSGRRGDGWRRFMTDLHRELSDADTRRREARAARPAKLRAIGD